MPWAAIAPYVMRIGIAAAAAVALWLAYAYWRDALIERGVQQERALWEAKNLAQTVQNEKTRAERAEAALEESRHNADASEKIKEVFQKLSDDQSRRMKSLRDQLALSDAQLFEPPRDGDCRVYVKPAFIHAANGISQ